MYDETKSITVPGEKHRLIDLPDMKPSGSAAMAKDGWRANDPDRPTKGGKLYIEYYNGSVWVYPITEETRQMFYGEGASKGKILSQFVKRQSVGIQVVEPTPKKEAGK